MDIKQAYEDSLRSAGLLPDVAQRAIVEHLAGLQQRLVQHQARRRSVLDILLRRRVDETGVRGLYLWGGVGRGKTFLMDLFFETLSVERKKRIHFHRMMHDVHLRLQDAGNIQDPLDSIAADIAAETQVLCFDEFFVSDIGDAMLLGRLLEGLFRRGVTLVATSNAKPDELYKDGLQRQQFLPAIALLNKHTDIIKMDSGTDYRLRLLQKAGTYLTPHDDAAIERLKSLFTDSATSEIEERCSVEINSRQIPVLRRAKGIVWFEFDAICGGPRSQSDYIEIARWYPSVIVSNVPLLDSKQEDQARRFIALVDEFYDRRVKLIISAATPVDQLYSGARLQFEFERTASRLIEMQSEDYLALPHLA